MSELVVKSSSDLVSLRNSLTGHYKLDRQEADSWEVSLDKNPTNKSPEQLYLKLYELREYLNRSSAMYTKYMKFFIAASNMKVTFDEEYNTNLNLVFSQNLEELKQFRSTEEKTRYCSGLMDQEIVKRKEQATLFLQEVQGFYSFFRAKHGFLSSINGDILTQLGILKLMWNMKDTPSPTEHINEGITDNHDFIDNIQQEGSVSL